MTSDRRAHKKSSSSTSALRFPGGFLWGCASSAYQIEGSLSEDGRSLSNWDVFCRTPGKVFGGDTAEVACGHYRRFDEDLRLLSDVGVGAYRFSTGWPRIMPAGSGPVNEKGLDFYERLVDGLLARGIEPWLALYHWDHPQVLDESGGWRNRDFPRRFADYAAAVARRLSDRVSRWITMNEPPCIAVLGYETGFHAPGLQLPPREVNQVIHHVLLGHGLAAQAIRQVAARPVTVGLAHNPDSKIPLTPSPEDRASAKAAWRRANAWWFDPLFKGSYPEDLMAEKGAAAPEIKTGDMDAIRQPLDFMGLNIYHGVRVRAGAAGPEELHFTEGLPVTEMGWPVTPEALYWGPLFFHEEYPAQKLMITESGAAFPDMPDGGGRVEDRRRIEYLDAHLRHLHRAVEEGVPVGGYFVWTLLDNFEWAYGYSKKFGLVRLEKDLTRVPKASAAWYRGVIERNGLG